MEFSKRHVELCINGIAKYKYSLACPLDFAMISSLGRRVGNLKYAPDFPRPFFQMHSVEKKIKVQGVEGEETFTVLFTGREHAPAIVFFEQALIELPDPSATKE